ncbi:uncharacterized protein BP01DRAFT_383225 [Aspergillus saccharolyticus JOP 1030-1]|uniref:BTB domain-containing protein n=1 Tax=Aspergillus saccharolyticus JOP 1030-1 TaxID=1450539 RepID=A0A318ZEG1_9EURO|nr:hypothetical protein BP01DRAFT_383225 [Aspergillus saccharolyticus JOP 1030-1]PYH44654.1 hypothetical protein BP01DRAFT_383225 [Aspergillus saccharolyticus JOP 1030-1]
MVPPAPKGSLNLHNALSQSMNTGQFSDLRFVCKERHFLVHKIIVCPQSPVIATGVNGPFRESQTASISMDKFDTSTAECLVDHLYTGDYDSHSRIPTIEASSAASASELECLSPPGPRTDMSLSEHIRVNAIGDYYQVVGLIALANDRIRDLLQSSNSYKITHAELPAAVDLALNSTANTEVFDILAEIMADGLLTVIEWEEVKSLKSEMPDFAIKVLQSCVGKMRELHKQIQGLNSDLTCKDHELQSNQKAYQMAESELTHIKLSFEVLNKTSICRNPNCHVKFECYFDDRTYKLRCERCGCRHSLPYDAHGL